MKLVVRSVTRRTGPSGVYRQPISVVRRFVVLDNTTSITPATAEVLVSGNPVVVSPRFAGASVVLVEGNATGVSATIPVIVSGKVERTIVSRLVTRRTGGAGVYRQATTSIRRVSLIVINPMVTKQPAAGTVLVESGQPVIMPRTPAAAEVLINSNAVTLSREGTWITSPGAGQVLIDGNRPLAFSPAAMISVMAKAASRRRFSARYASLYPPSPFDSTTRTVLQPPFGRLVQLGAGEVLLVGPRPTLFLDSIQLAGAQAGEVLVVGNAPFAFWRAEYPAGAGVVEIFGYPPLLTPILADSAVGSGVVEIVGYNPTIDRSVAWSAIAENSMTWSATTTVVGSWSDVVVTTSIWTRQ